MSVRTYENFDLLVERIPGGRFRARVTRSPAGETQGVDVDAPFDTLTRQNLMLRIDPGRSGMRGPVAEATDPTRLLGGGLWDSIFTGEVREAWQGSRIHANDAGRGLRMRLVLDEAPDLAALPWELLYDDDDDQFVAQSERTPIVRYLQMGSPLRPLKVNGPLDMLVVVSSPVDLPKLDVDAEYEHVKESLALAEGAGSIRIQRLPKPTIAELAKWLRDHEVNVLHFIGHGDYLPARSEGVVYFTDEAGKAFPVSADVLGPYAQDHDPLRLVVLNACRTASAGDTDGAGGLAQGLVRRDIGAVVAMQFPISDGAAATFSREFYGATADGFPVDQAVTNARKALYAEFGSEWATPVLFLRSPDGVVFDPTSLGSATKEAAASDPPTSPGDPMRAPSDRPPAPNPVPTPVPTPVPEERRPEPEAPTPESGRRGLIGAVAGGVALLAAAAVIVVPRLQSDGTPTGSSSATPGASTSAPSGTGPTSGRPTTGGAVLLTGPAVQAGLFDAPPTIDGDPSEWTGRPTYTTGSVVFPHGGRPTVGSTWRLGWDENFFYAVVEVTDAVLTQTNAGKLSQLYNGDGVSFELGSELRPTSTTALPPDDVHVLYGVTPEGRVLQAINVVRRGLFKAGEDLTDGEAAARVVPGGYVIELALPWADVGVDPAEGEVLAANLNVSDAFASGDNRGGLKTMQSNNPGRVFNSAEFRRAWGTLTLVD